MEAQPPPPTLDARADRRRRRRRRSGGWPELLPAIVSGGPLLAPTSPLGLDETPWCGTALDLHPHTLQAPVQDFWAVMQEPTCVDGGVDRISRSARRFRYPPHSAMCSVAWPGCPFAPPPRRAESLDRRLNYPPAFFRLLVPLHPSRQIPRGSGCSACSAGGARGSDHALVGRNSPGGPEVAGCRS
ncbi:hypothetical protein B2J93_1365 [Marssonina coronariae]|uniref:Uncharacterized protein n=1 Tax=Diplocarpon coronariae TaxID=2795749 RepID=A0A218ZBF4_9HELO|nr:hypothetical protein B2J93_1365 [Marssonina coronariae]